MTPPQHDQVVVAKAPPALKQTYDNKLISEQLQGERAQLHDVNIA